MKKLMCCFLSAALLFFAACGPLNTEKEQVKIKVIVSPVWRGVLSESEKDATYLSFMEYAAQRFNKLPGNENIKIEIDLCEGTQRTAKIKHSLGTENSPDVVMDSFFTMADYAHTGKLVSLNDIIEKNDRLDIGTEVLGNVTIQNNVYSYPFLQMPCTLAYNADLFKAAGLSEYISEKNEIATWSVSEFDNILKALKENLPSSITPMSMYAGNDQGDAFVMMLLRMFGNQFIQGSKIMLNNPQGIKALEWLKNGYESGYFPQKCEKISLNTCDELFFDGNIAISMLSSGTYNAKLQAMELGQLKKSDLRIANIPNNELGAATFSYVWGCSVFDNGDEQKIEAAKSFVRFVCSDTELVQSSVNGIPVRSSVMSERADEIVLLSAYRENNKKYMVNFTGGVPNYQGIRSIFCKEIAYMLSGETTPEQAALNIEQKGNAAIQLGKVESIFFK